jgi:membrane-bound metal-dependent hydrolase YbcI (DUF457 family)
MTGVLVGLLITTGAAMINDLDHHKATMTRSLGPLSWVSSRLIIFVFGPHRHGTHSILFVAVLGIGAQMALIYRHSPAGLIALCWLMVLSVAAVVRLAKIPGWIDDIAAAVIVILVVWLTDIDLRIVPAALMLGAFVHIAGDCLTDRGCPIFWPLSKRRYTLDLFTTGKTGEKIFFVAVVIGILITLAYQIIQFARGF